MHCLCEKRCPRGCVLGMLAPGEPAGVRVGQVAVGAERATRALLHCLPVALRETERVSKASGREACAWGSGPRAPWSPLCLLRCSRIWDTASGQCLKTLIGEWGWPVGVPPLLLSPLPPLLPAQLCCPAWLGPSASPVCWGCRGWGEGSGASADSVGLCWGGWHQTGRQCALCGQWCRERVGEGCVCGQRVVCGPRASGRGEAAVGEADL